MSATSDAFNCRSVSEACDARTVLTREVSMLRSVLSCRASARVDAPRKKTETTTATTDEHLPDAGHRLRKAIPNDGVLMKCKNAVPIANSVRASRAVPSNMFKLRIIHAALIAGRAGGFRNSATLGHAIQTNNRAIRNEHCLTVNPASLEVYAEIEDEMTDACRDLMRHVRRIAGEKSTGRGEIPTGRWRNDRGRGGMVGAASRPSVDDKSLPLIGNEIIHGLNRTRAPQLEQCATDSWTFPVSEC